MTNWTARAKAPLVRAGKLLTARTDETQLSSVSSVSTSQCSHRVSTVSSVTGSASVKNMRFTSDLLEAAMAVCDHYLSLIHI